MPVSCLPTTLSGLLEKGIRLNQESSDSRIPHYPGFLQPQRWLLLSLFGGFLIAQKAPGLCTWPFSLASQYIHTILVTPSSLMALNTIDMQMIQSWALWNCTPTPFTEPVFTSCPSLSLCLTAGWQWSTVLFPENCPQLTKPLAFKSTPLPPKVQSIINKWRLSQVSPEYTPTVTKLYLQLEPLLPTSASPLCTKFLTYPPPIFPISVNGNSILPIIQAKNL